MKELKDLEVSNILQEDSIPTKLMKKTLIFSRFLYTRASITLLMLAFFQHQFNQRISRLSSEKDKKFKGKHCVKSIRILVRIFPVFNSIIQKAYSEGVAEMTKYHSSIHYVVQYSHGVSIQKEKQMSKRTLIRQLLSPVRKS